MFHEPGREGSRGAYREDVDREIQAAMRETPHILDDDRRRRLNEVEQAITVTEDDAQRRTLTIERAALIQLGKTMAREESRAAAPTQVEDLDDLQPLPPELEEKYLPFGKQIPKASKTWVELDKTAPWARPSNPEQQDKAA